MKHNITGHGYGVQREVRASQRGTTSIGGRTPQSADLGLTGMELAQRDINRVNALMPDNWAAMDRVQLMARRDRIMGNVVPSTKPKRNTVSRTYTDAERLFNDNVDVWYHRCANAIYPERFIMTDVPPMYRHAVIMRAATV